MLVAGAQTRIGQTIQENITSARRLLLEATERGAVITCLSEYFSFPRTEMVSQELVDDVRAETIAFLENITAKTSSVVVGGSVPVFSDKGYKNICYVYDCGQRIASIEKEKVTAGEKALGIIEGSQKDIFNVDGISATARVCADILFPETCFGLRNKISLLFVPLISPLRANDPTRKRRDCLFIVRAFDSNSYVIKTGSVGFAPLTGHPIAGRSLIASPSGILAKSTGENQEMLLIEDLDFEKLADFDLLREMFP